jgi:hypothetical protein
VPAWGAVEPRGHVADRLYRDRAMAQARAEGVFPSIKARMGSDDAAF